MLRMTLRNPVLLRAVLLLVLLLPALLLASSRSEEASLTIKVISSQTLPLAPTDRTYAVGCNQTDYSAECMHSKDHFVQNKILVETDDGRRYTIACIVESRWSNCIPLPEGQSFHARLDKTGLQIVYLGAKGKPHKQHYDLVAH